MCIYAFSSVFRTLNGTFVQCVAGVRPGRGSGPVSIFIDNSVSESDADFTYIEDPRVFSVSPMNIIRRYVSTYS